MRKMKLLLLSFTFAICVTSTTAGANPSAPWTTTAKTSTAKTSTAKTSTAWTPTTESPGLNLNGKMLTLSNDGGASFYRPGYHPYGSTTRSPYYTTRSPYHTTSGSWTPAPEAGGVSVCLRYLSDYGYLSFTLSPSRSPLTFSNANSGYYQMSFSRYYNGLNFIPNLRFWANAAPDIWTRVCFTVDSRRKVAQVFSGPNISTRKMFPQSVNYVWSGEPVVDFTGYNGQLTDIQVWDYPLSYKEVFNYMMGGVYMPYGGSALSWSHISYSPRGRTLLEDNYELQGRRPVGSGGLRKHRPKWGRKAGRKAGRFSHGGKMEREPL